MIFTFGGQDLGELILSLIWASVPRRWSDEDFAIFWVIRLRRLLPISADAKRNILNWTTIPERTTSNLFYSIWARVMDSCSRTLVTTKPRLELSNVFTSMIVTLKDSGLICGRRPSFEYVHTFPHEELQFHLEVRYDATSRTSVAWLNGRTLRSWIILRDSFSHVLLRSHFSYTLDSRFQPF